MSVKFYPPGHLFSDRTIRWGSPRSRGRVRGCAIFYELCHDSQIVTSPIYWAEVTEGGSYSVWGSGETSGKCASLDEATRAAEAFVESEYRRLLGLELAKLEAEAAVIREKLRA